MFAPFANALPVSLRRVGQTVLACSVLMLAACGGGGDRVKDYQPTSVVSFGDETSAFTSAKVTNTSGGEKEISGLVYGVNVFSPFLVDTLKYCVDGASDLAELCSNTIDVDTVEGFAAAGSPNYLYQVEENDIDGLTVLSRLDSGLGSIDGAEPASMKRQVNQTFDCRDTVIWIQRVANYFGKGYQDSCSSGRDGAVSYAEAGAKAADLAAQIADAKAADQLKEGVLVTLWLGQNDLYEVFESNSSTKEADVRNRAALIIDGVKDILGTGAKVLLVSAPNLAYSPFAVAQGAQQCDDESKRLCNKEMDGLVSAFNSQLFTSLGQDYALQGRNLGFIDAAEISNRYSRSGSYENKAVCTQDLFAENEVLFCNTYNLIDGANISRDLWLDEKRMGYVINYQVSEYALIRATEQF